MFVTDEHNRTMDDSTMVDAVNASFYHRFPYPWPASVFESLEDPQISTLMLNQSCGSWDHSFIPSRPKIWVAGCGTNQAAVTALRFSQGTVLGTDLSSASLATSANTCKQLKIANVEFRQQSINDAPYSEEFDHVICTGVIHHNADARMPLRRLHAALKPSGICELMVYNKYHRLVPVAFQKAVRIFTGRQAMNDFDVELDYTRRIIRSDIPGSMGAFLSALRDSHESIVADCLLQPVEQHFTVESLETLLDSCGFEFAAPCISQFGRDQNCADWNMQFGDPELQRAYEALPDARRWQISNLLLHEQSPLLWFYIRRKDAQIRARPESQLCEEFLARKFRCVNTRRRLFVQSEQNGYGLNPKHYPHPAIHPDSLCRNIVAAVARRPALTMKEILFGIRPQASFMEINRMRLMLTTDTFPYLVAC